MPSPVTIERSGTSVILRWYQGGIGVRRNELLATARLEGPAILGDRVPVEVRAAAHRAWELMVAGRWAEVEAMATHRWRWRLLTLRRELVPIGGDRRG